MARLLPDSDLINTNGADLTWAQLAALQQRADAGDTSAAVALAAMPKGAAYNAKLITKAFKPPKKAKPPKLVTKALKTPEPARSSPQANQGMIARQMARIVATTDDPSEREHARAYLESL